MGLNAACTSCILRPAAEQHCGAKCIIVNAAHPSHGVACMCSAMGGAVLFEDALAARLDLMRPSRATLAAFLAAHPPRLTPGALLLQAMHGHAWVLAGRAHLSSERPLPQHVVTASLTVREAWEAVTTCKETGA